MPVAYDGRADLGARAPNQPPVAILLDPQNQTVVNSTAITLTWSVSDSDGDQVRSSVCLSPVAFDPNSTPEPVAYTNGTSYNASGLQDLWTYYWTVIPNDGHENGTVLQIWNFTVRLPGNHLPEVKLLAPQDGFVSNSSNLRLAWSASDADGDLLSYLVFMSEAPLDPPSLPPAAANTTDTHLDVSNLMDGRTYHWTVLANDGRANGGAAPAWSFSLTIVVPAGAPAVVDWGPKGVRNPVKPALLVMFDRDMDARTVFPAILLVPALDITGFVRFNTTFQFILGSEFSYSTTYSVTVGTTARSVSGIYLAQPFRWNFTTLAPGETASELPSVLFTDPGDGARHVDPGKNVTVVFSQSMNRSATENSLSVMPPADLRPGWLNQKGYALQLVPGSPLPNGTYRVVISAQARDESGNPLDGNGNGVADGAADLFSFNFTVGNPPAIKPRLLYLSPEGQHVALNGIIRLAFDRSMNLSAVRSAFSIDPPVDGVWTADAEGKNLTFAPSGKLHPARTYSVMLNSSASDIGGTPLENSESWSFTTAQAATTPTGAFPWWVLAAFGAVFVLGLAGLAVFAYSRRKNAPGTAKEAAPAKPDEDTPTEAPQSSVPSVPPPSPPPPVLPATPVVASPLPVPVTTSPPVPVSPPPAQTLAGSPTTLAISPATPPAPPPPTPRAGFTIEDIFLMYRDGRLVLHTTRRLKADMDAAIMASMFKAVQLFVKETVGRQDASELGSMEYGEDKILFENGKQVIIAAVINGPEHCDFRDEMRAAVKNVEAEYGAVLPIWDGSVSKLSGAKRFLTMLADFKPPEGSGSSPGPCDVTLKGELEFYHGFIRLKVNLKNGMTTVMMNPTFKLIYNDSALKLYAVEPDLARRGDDLVLGTIGLGETRSMTFYLDPQICTESYIEGLLSFMDARGTLETAKLARRLASVVCPILYTDENINTAMLKRMVVEELEQKETKLFSIPPMITAKVAFEIGKSAIRHHDLKLVREFVEHNPYTAEAWYYGKAKGRPDKLVVRTRVLSAKNYLEFFVATDSVLMLTGMLAELKSDLNKELDTRSVRTGMRQVTSQAEVEALSSITTLLEKATEAELAAG
jgi:hypothetical protein